MSPYSPALPVPAAPATGVWAAARTGARQALQWRLLLLWLLALALPVLLAAVPLGVALNTLLSRSLLGVAQATQLDLTVLMELMASLGLRGYGPASALPALIVLLVLLPGLSGLVVTAAQRPGERLGFGALLSGALAAYGRMARLWVWALLLLGLAGAAGAGLVHLANEAALRQVLQSDADQLKHAALAVGTLIFLWVHATLDAARAQFVIDPQRRSAVLAWWAALKGMLRRPKRWLIYALITLFGLALAAVLARARLQWPAVGLGGLALSLLLGQALVAVLAWMRCARLLALVAAAR